ncbi:polyol transporter 5-like [Camellia sinensis]|uniref:Major facilitator superfamily (MFS) profile domain-containing protein n=1 Tax=Camellia sinensis var. sinensis TaxID=542762 RepID=A0A4V3WKF9_CAMSN|nr:polyol transporter 5-like [Camellia sinensis]THG00727.1 hypothetical protein TEA_019882 [Camellia sinensis var. sinensis]
MADRKPQNNGFSSQTQIPIPGLDPRNKYAFACAILASMTSMLIGYDVGVMSGAGPFIKDDLKISDVQLEILMGILNVYCLLGSVAAGQTSNWVGRRYTIVVASAIHFLGAILMGFATNYAFLMVGRFVAGIGAGYAIMIAPVYTAELSPANCRGFLGSFPEFFGNAGVLLGYVSNYAFSKLPLQLGWRFMLGVGVIPSMFLALGVLAMPESPRWLVLQGRLGDAKRVLDKTSNSKEEAQCVAGMVVSLATLGVSLTIIDHSEKKLIWAVALAITSVLAYVATFSIGMWPITWDKLGSGS